MSAVATRDIFPGEEITISCTVVLHPFCLLLTSDSCRQQDIFIGMPSRYRRRSLSNWAFTCTCGLCSSPPEALAASDSRREKLVDIMHAMRQPDTDYETLVALTREFVDIVQVERLEAKVGEYYQAFMKVYYDFGDTESALRYAQTALKYAETFADPDGGFCTALRGDMEMLRGMLERGE